MLLVALLLAPSPASAWSSALLADAARPVGDVAIGDGDRDGKLEVYGVGEHLYQVRHTSSGWVSKIVAQVPQGGAYFTSVAVGDGDRDGKPEVYAGKYGGWVRRYAWNGSAWSASTAASLGGGGSSVSVASLSVGDADNDSLRELWAVVDVPTSDHDGAQVWKVWFKDGAWHQGMVANVSGQPSTSWIGDGDRDGQRELYFGTLQGDVWRVKHTSSGWRATHIGAMGDEVNGVATGDANHDGKVEVYAASADHHIARFLWNGTAWRKVDVQDLGQWLWDLTIADIDGDGGTELYAAAADGHAYRVAWTGSAWATTDLGAPGPQGDAPFSVAAGDADNDGHRELAGGMFVDVSGTSGPTGAFARWVP
jgi:hypothetical protein